MENVTLSNRDIETLLRSRALTRMADSRELRPKVQFDLSKFLKRFDVIAGAYTKVKLGIINKYCIKDRDGKPSPKDDGSPRFTTPDEEKANKELDELLSEKTEMTCRKVKIKLEELQIKEDMTCIHCGKMIPMSRSIVSAVDMAQLECIVDFEE